MRKKVKTLKPIKKKLWWMFLQPTVIPNVKMEECVFALENADVLLDLEEDTVTKVNEFMGAGRF